VKSEPVNKRNTNIGQCTNGNMTGGSAFVAYAEKYGDTGIATFMINQNGVVYRRTWARIPLTLRKG